MFFVCCIVCILSKCCYFDFVVLLCCLLFCVYVFVVEIFNCDIVLFNLMF